MGRKHSLKSARRRRGGISEIIATVLMVLLVVSISTAVYAYTANGLGTYGSNFSNLVSNQGNAIAQEMSVEQATFSLTTAIPYITLKISNSQTSSTSAPFQQFITFNPSLYTSYEASDLGNIRFFSALQGNSFTGPLDSWLESTGSTPANSANSANFWLKLPNGISGSSSVTVYMVFEATTTEFDGNVAGEAPQLSSTYGNYDNGAIVFLAYVNGNTPTSQFNLGSNINLAQATGVAYPGASSGINALHLTGTGTQITMVYAQTTLANSPMIAESNFESEQTPTSQGPVAFDDNSAPSSSQNAIGVNMGYASSYFSQAYESGGTYYFDLNQQGTANTNWNYASLTYLGPSGASFSGYIAPQLYSANGGYSGTQNNNPLSGASNIYLSILSSAGSSYPDNMYYNWIRARASPPSGVMPSVSIGSFNSGNQAGANIYVRNVGTVPLTIASIYVQNVTSSTLVLAYTVSPQINIEPGNFAKIMVPFIPDAGETYEFTVVTTLGTSQIASFPE